ncbi:MAG: cobyrinate a,c-diamide synthase [Eubacteriales bacterium]
METKNAPRVIIAGTSSGSGKTTVTCALLQLMKRAGMNPSALKCGPDYIDPMFHTSVIGVESANLDPFFCGGGLLRYLTAKNSVGSVSVIEGVMGYYDGTGDDGCENSTYRVAVETQSPVILVVNGSGAAVSSLAVLQGFVDFKPSSGIKGVIFNNVSSATYALLKRLTERRFSGSVAVLGYVPRLPQECLLGSRHLGLITAAEVDGLREKLSRAADIIGETIELDKILSLAASAPALEYETPRLAQLGRVRIAVAKDRAFCFYYKDNLSLLREAGAEIVFFSPLENEPLPCDIDGIYIGGGYPELYSDALAKNRISAESVCKAVRSGVPTIAECGGFMYIGAEIDGRPMCGALGHKSTNSGKLVRFGYVTLSAHSDGLFGKAGQTFRGHEFHYYDSTDSGGGFTAEKTNGKCYSCAVYTDTLYAGYPHLYFYSNPAAAMEFYRACRDHKAKPDND